MNGGDVILADEPTGALDSKSSAERIDLLLDLNRQRHTIIIVTHDQKVAAYATPPSRSATAPSSPTAAATQTMTLLVGGNGMVNFLLVSVTERTREIGGRIAFAMGGGLLAEALSHRLRLSFSTLSIAAAFLSSTLIGIAFGFLPARSAAQLDPVEALSRDCGGPVQVWNRWRYSPGGRPTMRRKTLRKAPGSE